MAKPRKKFWETKIGAFLKKNAPKAQDLLLDTAENYFPPVGIIREMFPALADNKGVSGLTADQTVELHTALDHYEMVDYPAWFADVQSAREMQKAAYTQEDRFTKRFLMYLTIGLLLSCFGFDYYVLTAKLTVDNREIVFSILGFVNGTIISQVVNFWFGSSLGSMQKSATLQGLNQTTPNDTTTAK